MKFTETTIEKCVANIQNLNGILFFGTNFGLMNSLGDYLVSKFQPEERVIIDYQDVENTFSQTLHMAMDRDFFSSKKVVKVFNFKLKTAKDIQFLENENFNDRLLLIFGNELDGRSSIKSMFEKSDKLAVITCYDDDLQTAIGVINEFCEKHNLKADNNVKRAIAEDLHGDRLVLMNELEKFAILCDGGEITIDEVKNTIENEQEFNPGELVDEILLGNRINAVKLFERAKVDDVQTIQLAHILSNSVGQLLDMHRHMKRGASVEDVIREQFIFFKRVPIIKRLLAGASVKANIWKYYLKCANEIEICAKKFGNDIARAYFEKYIVLFGVK